MDWIADNWIAVALLTAFLALHLFGHGHAHGRRACQRAESEPPRSAGGGHAHGAADATQDEHPRRHGC